MAEIAGPSASALVLPKGHAKGVLLPKGVSAAGEAKGRSTGTAAIPGTLSAAANAPAPCAPARCLFLFRAGAPCRCATVFHVRSLSITHSLPMRLHRAHGWPAERSHATLALTQQSHARFKAVEPSAWSQGNSRRTHRSQGR
jgi:hypothetical protein